jgi:hypothetical protein
MRVTRSAADMVLSVNVNSLSDNFLDFIRSA